MRNDRCTNQDLAATFVDLLDKRHLADYDLTERFKRSYVLTLITGVIKDIQDFQTLGASNEKQLFLSWLWAWPELANR